MTIFDDYGWLFIVPKDTIHLIVFISSREKPERSDELKVSIATPVFMTGKGRFEFTSIQSVTTYKKVNMYKILSFNSSNQHSDVPEHLP